MAPENDTTRPLLVELVGPAGVGKSALAERLTARSGVVRASVWNLPRWLLLESAARSHRPVVASDVCCLGGGARPPDRAGRRRAGPRRETAPPPQAGRRVPPPDHPRAARRDGALPCGIRARARRRRRRRWARTAQTRRDGGLRRAPPRSRARGLGTTAPWLTRCGSSHRPRRPNAPGPTSP